MSDPFVHELHIDAPPETVFDHFCSPVLIQEWFGFPTEFDPTEGGRFRIAIARDLVAVGASP